MKISLWHDVGATISRERRRYGTRPPLFSRRERTETSRKTVSLRFWQFRFFSATGFSVRVARINQSVKNFLRHDRQVPHTLFFAARSNIHKIYLTQKRSISWQATQHLLLHIKMWHGRSLRVAKCTGIKISSWRIYVSENIRIRPALTSVIWMSMTFSGTERTSYNNNHYLLSISKTSDVKKKNVTRHNSTILRLSSLTMRSSLRDSQTIAAFQSKFRIVQLNEFSNRSNKLGLPPAEISTSLLLETTRRYTRMSF